MFAGLNLFCISVGRKTPKYIDISDQYQYLGNWAAPTHPQPNNSQLITSLGQFWVRGGVGAQMLRCSDNDIDPIYHKFYKPLSRAWSRTFCHIPNSHIFFPVVYPWLGHNQVDAFCDVCSSCFWRRTFCRTRCISTHCFRRGSRDVPSGTFCCRFYDKWDTPRMTHPARAWNGHGTVSL